MTALIAYLTVAAAATAALWALGLRWIHNLNAADTYRREWTRDRIEPTWLRTAMLKQRRAS